MLHFKEPSSLFICLLYSCSFHIKLQKSCRNPYPVPPTRVSQAEDASTAGGGGGEGALAASLKPTWWGVL